MINNKVKIYEDPDKLLNSKEVDAVIIATPHYDHPPLAIKAFSQGIHVLSEKPAGVYTAQVREMNMAAKRSGCVFALMFNQRTLGEHRKLKEMVESDLEFVKNFTY